mgnify:CR=1 FL=1
MMNELYDFLRQLAENNDREWFHSHKHIYDRLHKQFESDVARLIAIMSEYEPEARGLSVKQCVYRIYRDVRFSPDKSPYKRHFAACIGRGGRQCMKSCYYIHIQPGHSFIGGGIWMTEGDTLAKIRSLMDAEGDEFHSIITSPDFASRYYLAGDPLKKMPKGFSEQTSHPEYVKMKQFLFCNDVPNEYFTQAQDWVAKVADDLRYLKPAHDFINYVFD